MQLLEALNRLYKVDVDVAELKESAAEIRKKMEDMAAQVDGLRKQQPSAGRPGYERMYA